MRAAAASKTQIQDLPYASPPYHTIRSAKVVYITKVLITTLLVTGKRQGTRGGETRGQGFWKKNACPHGYKPITSVTVETVGQGSILLVPHVPSCPLVPCPLVPLSLVSFWSGKTFSQSN